MTHGRAHAVCAEAEQSLREMEAELAHAARGMLEEEEG